MQVLCEATQCKDMRVQVAALQNMVKIMSLYYQYMESYMGPALFAVSPLFTQQNIIYYYFVWFDEEYVGIIIYFVSNNFAISELSLMKLILKVTP